jgi:formate--tetrahydrofolate ligase
MGYLMKSDLEIAQNAKLKTIIPLVKEKIGLDGDVLSPYGHYKAKLSLKYIQSLKDKPDGKLILVTAISPTPPGEGKTTTTVGLGDALNEIGEKAIICIREPSLGPVFGMKGGANGGGMAQVVPMDEINLHFTGDFSAIALANNLLSALIDNHLHHGNALNIDTRSITWRRVMDMNDRALRKITIGQGGANNGYVREDGFDIVVASEVMAIFCLANDFEDLKIRLGRIVIGYTTDKKPVLASDLNAHGAMAALLKDAFSPNLVQTLEGNIAFVHGGPFANIAHGCNSVIATKTALKLADYVVTEAGFGADLGAEKFIDIKCRKSGLAPSAVVLVATVRALKYHGGVEAKETGKENLDALKKGLVNLEKHITNIQNHFGLPCVVAINHFSDDTDAEIALLKSTAAQYGVEVILAKHWALGGKGATELAHAVVKLCDKSSRMKFVYEDNIPLIEKITAVATKIYGAKDVSADKKILEKLSAYEQAGYRHYPVCIAKNQYSFSTDPTLRGAPTGHTLNIREIRLSAGAEFIVVVCGDIMTMPGLPKIPSANSISVDENGKISGLF